MGILDFKCPICGGDVTCEPEISKCFASLDFKCRKCGVWVDVDITSEAEMAKDDAMEYFDSQVKRIEGDA